MATVFFLFFSFALGCCAADELRLSLDADSSGKSLCVNVNAEEGSCLYTTEFYILYNPDELEFKQGSELCGAAAQELSPYITATVTEQGRLKVSYTATQPLEQGGALLGVEFKAKADALTVLELEIEHAETFDGEHIRSLSFFAQGTQAKIEKQNSVLPVAVAAAGVCVVVGAALLIIKKKKK